MKKYIAALALLCMLSACADRVSSSSDDKKTTPAESEVSSAAVQEDSSSQVQKELKEKNVQEQDSTALTDTSEDVSSEAQSEIKERTSIYEKTPGVLESTDDLGLRNTDGEGSEYEFDYDGEVFTAVYTPDNWKIVDSYKITNSADMLLICQALIDENPLHGRDMVSFRVPEDMVDEWMQHNLAYKMFYDNPALRARAKDVDLNPDDQGKNIIEKYAEIAGLLD